MKKVIIIQPPRRKNSSGLKSMISISEKIQDEFMKQLNKKIHLQPIKIPTPVKLVSPNASQRGLGWHINRHIDE